jgi:hypothetical protein
MSKGNFYIKAVAQTNQPASYFCSIHQVGNPNHAGMMCHVDAHHHQVTPFESADIAMNFLLKQILIYEGYNFEQFIVVYNDGIIEVKLNRLISKD